MKGRNKIRALFLSGKRLTVWPLRVTYLPAEETEVLFNAPKSLFKHAVDRNRLRRQMRAAWRLQEPKTKGMLIAFNYIDKAMQPYTVIAKSIRKAVEKMG